ncbi:hypothetical protein [Burkholderia sp. Se-20378]|uniref:hypothetical protein n=1 Tax=Burkholderia sp. Se-20378 TaxID=2703899 RepID=UPI00198250A9|nr:hypothetical protein [Burkholderia sp. Se-20378]MBN3769114.1 hypothetical protein [Burkholderia sp. Se-20378]
MSSVVEIETVAPEKKKARKKLLPKINRLFCIVVLIPTLTSSIYYGLIASDIYVSESRFIIKGTRNEVKSGIGALLQGVGFSRSEDDAHSVHDYVLSRDAVKKLTDKFELDQIFGNKKIDIFSRYSPFGFDKNFESLYKYYQRRVALDTDSSSSISVLQVRAYTAEDAYRINETLLEMSENLVNELNQRALQDTIKFAAQEVNAAEKRDAEAALQLAQYRNKLDVFDPERQSAMQLQIISKLQDDLIAAKTQLAQLNKVAAQNPQIPPLRERISSLQSAIDAQMSQVTGGDRSLTKKSAEFERLKLNLEFADKQLTLALASLQQARDDAQRKQVYLERIVQPNEPDKAIEPRRIRAVLTTFVLGLIIMGILNLLIAGVREHKD